MNNQPFFWTGSNNSTYLRSRRKASSKLAAVRDAKKFLRNELMGDGTVVVFSDNESEHPTIIIERSIHTGYRCIRKEHGKPQRTITL